jgi:predicted MPP superfamily phosphohydrolase
VRIKVTRRGFLAGSVIAGLGVLLDMKYIEPHWLCLSRVEVPLPDWQLPNRLKIMHIADMHASDVLPVKFVRKAIELGLEAEPDLVCITGDMISHLVTERDEYVEALSLLSETCPVFACPGNHDGGDWVQPMGGYSDLSEIRGVLNEANIPLLLNELVTVSIRGTEVEIVGLGDYWAGATDPQKAFVHGNGKGLAPRIVLSHNPDSKTLLEDYAWDLMLCGHTHGGQLSLPLIGTPFAPVKDHRFVHGLNGWKGRQIYTTRGIGNLHGLRLNCRPEVSILSLS